MSRAGRNDGNAALRDVAVGNKMAAAAAVGRNAKNSSEILFEINIE